jgi:hypothetical protein
VFLAHKILSRVNKRFRIIHVTKKNLTHATNGNRIITTSIITAMIDEKGLNVPNIYGTKNLKISGTLYVANIWGNTTTFSSDDYYRIFHICNE